MAHRQRRLEEQGLDLEAVTFAASEHDLRAAGLMLGEAVKLARITKLIRRGFEPDEADDAGAPAAQTSRKARYREGHNVLISRTGTTTNVRGTVLRCTTTRQQ